MKKNLSGISLELISGDIAAQEDITAVVNAANARLRTGGGVAGAIHRAAGPGLEKETASLAPIKPGEAVITSGNKLPNKYVIHCLGPVYGVDKPEDKLLASCYRNALKIAEEKRIDSIAFPAISTGAFAYPLKEAASVAFATIFDLATVLEYCRKIRFVLFSDRNREIHEEVFLDYLSRRNE